MCLRIAFSMGDWYWYWLLRRFLHLFFFRCLINQHLNLLIIWDLIQHLIDFRGRHFHGRRAPICGVIWSLILTYSRVITPQCSSISHTFFSVATCTRVLVCMSLSYSSLISLVNDTSVIVVVRTYAVFANFIFKILSPDFSSTCIVPYPSTFMRSFGVLIQSDAGLISLKKRFLSYVRGSLHPESYMTLLVKELISLITVFAKEKLPNRKLGILLFIPADDVVGSISFRRLMLQILFMIFKIQDFFCNRCLIWSRIFLSFVQSDVLADETMYEHSSNSWISSHTHFLAFFFEELFFLSFLLFWALSFWVDWSRVLSCNVTALTWSRTDTSSFKYASHAFL